MKLSRGQTPPPGALTTAGVVAALIFLALVAASAVTAEPRARPQEKKNKGEQRGEDETVRLHSDLVVLTVTVMDAVGQYARGLEVKDFTVVEDGQKQPVSLFLAEESPFAAAILLDMSGSMEQKFGLVRGAAAAFVERIRDDDQVAVYGFNEKVHLFQDYSNSRDISDYIWDAKVGKMTRLYDCISEAINTLAKRPERRRAVLLISDGWDTGSQSHLDAVLKRALASDVTVYTVDLVDNNLLLGNASYVAPLRQGRRDMQELAAQTGGRYIYSPQGDKLDEAFTSIVEELRNQYTLSYYPANPKRDGRWRKLNVSVARPGLSVRTRRGYFAPKQ